MGSVIQGCWHGRRIGTMPKAPPASCRGAGVQECRSAGVQECRSAGVQECRSSMKTTTDLKSIFQNAKSNKHGVNHIIKTIIIN